MQPKFMIEYGPSSYINLNLVTDIKYLAKPDGYIEVVVQFSNAVYNRRTMTHGEFERFLEGINSVLV